MTGTMEEKTDAILRRVTRADVLTVYRRETNRARRERQRYDAEDGRTRDEILADCLLAVYRAGLHDGLCAATEENK